MRNGLPFEIPGDKMYKNPEYSPGFFKNGGLIVGSSNRIKYDKTVGKRGNNFYETLDLNVKTLDHHKNFENKEKQKDLDYQFNFVKNLDAWEDNILVDYYVSKSDQKQPSTKKK